MLDSFRLKEKGDHCILMTCFFLIRAQPFHGRIAHGGIYTETPKHLIVVLETIRKDSISCKEGTVLN